MKCKFLDVYITPKNVSYGWYDNGVFQFSLNQQSIKVPFRERTYLTNINKDSVYELYYQRIVVSNRFLSNVEKLNISNENIGIKRIMLILKSDTLYIDDQSNLIKDDISYSIDNMTLNFIINLMPAEIKSNWNDNLSGR